MENSKTTNNLGKSASILRIIGLLLVLLSFTIFIYNSSKQENDLLIKNSEIIKKDSIISKIEVQSNAKDSLQSITREYLAFRNGHDVDALDKFYADTVAVYFKNLKNCNKDAIKHADKKYWATYKNDTFYLESEPEIVLNDSVPKALIKGRQCRTTGNCIGQIIELKFNDKHKITFVKAYYSK